MSKTLLKIEVADNKVLQEILGPNNSIFTQLTNIFNLEGVHRGNFLIFKGSQEPLLTVERIIYDLIEKAKEGRPLTPGELEASIRLKGRRNMDKKKDIQIKTPLKKILPRSENQSSYLQVIQENDLVFALGPAGTGKTYLAVAAAVEMFTKGLVDRLIFSRPAVEAGEKLGFLPGDLQEKVDPYLRPIYDALYEMLPPETIKSKLQSGEIEIAPLAFMRGRTLKNAFVILDEAQNTSNMQMLMLLTRLGQNSKMIITGDPSQVDLPSHEESGLLIATEKLKDIEGIHVSTLTGEDVVRHPLIAKIISAYQNK